jgi:hypothetical protein
MRGSSISEAAWYENSLNVGRWFLLSLGEERFGKPTEAIRSAIMTIRVVERLASMTAFVSDANIHDWEGLLLASASVAFDGWPPEARTQRTEAEAEAEQRAYILDSTTYLLMRDQPSNTAAYQSLQGGSNTGGWTYDPARWKEGPELERKIFYEVGRKLGGVVGAKRMLFRQGIKRFGTPDDATIAAIEAIKDSGPLEALGERIVDPGIQNWEDLLRNP